MPTSTLNFPTRVFGELHESSEQVRSELRTEEEIAFERVGTSPDEEDSSWKTSVELPPHVPLLTLDGEGYIQHLNEAARVVLEYSAELTFPQCFFSRVHGRNLPRVMRDLAYMVSQDKQYARWLLRLRRGKALWRWFHAVVENQLNRSEDRILVLLRPL